VCDRCGVPCLYVYVCVCTYVCVRDRCGVPCPSQSPLEVHPPSQSHPPLQVEGY
jgi:hypothetical protein